MSELCDGQDFKTHVNAEDVNVFINLYGKKLVAKSSKNLIKPDVKSQFIPMKLWNYSLTSTMFSKTTHMNKSQKISTNSWVVCLYNLFICIVSKIFCVS